MPTPDISGHLNGIQLLLVRRTGGGDSSPPAALTLLSDIV